MYWDVGEYLSGLCAASEFSKDFSFIGEEYRIQVGSQDDAVVEYALSRSMPPTLVPEYILRLPDKKLLRDKLCELTDLAMEAGERNDGQD